MDIVPIPDTETHFIAKGAVNCIRLKPGEASLNKVIDEAMRNRAFFNDQGNQRFLLLLPGERLPASYTKEGMREKIRF